MSNEMYAIKQHDDEVDAWVKKIRKVVLGVVVIIVISLAAFLGLHYFLSGGQLPLQPCWTCHAEIAGPP